LMLGYMLSRAGRPDEAAAAYRRCAELGDLGVNGNLGVLLMGQGKEQEAVDAWREGADAGYPGAAYFLGSYLMEQDEPLEGRQRLAAAKEGFLREMEFRNPDAFFFYGLACYELGQLDEATQAFQQAAALGRSGTDQMLKKVQEKRSSSSTP
jgi:tetratricopeptide (TPR) repeat protein